MRRSLPFVLVTLISLAAGRASAETDATLFRLFLTDGSALTSYGEYARVDDRVVFSMLVGGHPGQPRLHAATIDAASVDWPRTERHAASTRYQQYASTRGEEDFFRLSNDVAAVLNEVLQTRDRSHALDLAQQARTTLASWPRAHFGYRQREVQDILAIVDEAISGLNGTGVERAFDVTLVAMAPPAELEPVASFPTTREQVDQMFRVAALTRDASDRVALFQSALMVLNDAGGSGIPPKEIASLRRAAEREIKLETLTDQRYTALVRRVMDRAARAAARARIGDVEQLLDDIPRQDGRLGRRRPEVVEALRASVRVQLDAARTLRLQRDRWMIRRSLYREYQKAVGSQLLQLVKSQPALEAIRRLEGPPPATLIALRARFSGGAQRLERISPSGDLVPVHDLLVGAWRFAENAVAARYEAAEAAHLDTAWKASSAAAGALMLLSRVQQEIRVLLEPPRLR